VRNEIVCEMSREEYAKQPGISQSGLNTILNKSPWHYKFEMENPNPPTEAMLLGTALHAAILEPAYFRGHYAVAPACDLRTKAGKAELEEFKLSVGKKEILTSDDAGTITALLQKFMACDFTSKLITESQKEVAIFWEMEEAQCKGLVDIYCPSRNLIGDIKTTADCSPGGLKNLYGGSDIVSRRHFIAQGLLQLILQIAVLLL
jgi:hypothetical protein